MTLPLFCHYTFSLDRIQNINHHAQDFYITVERHDWNACRTDDFQQNSSHQIHGNLPIAVGFGISTQKCRICTGTCRWSRCWSLFVKALEEGMQLTDLSSLAREIFPRINNNDYVVLFCNDVYYFIILIGYTHESVWLEYIHSIMFISKKKNVVHYLIYF